MFVNRRFAAFATLALVAMSASPAMGYINSTIHLRAYVPVMCNIELFPSAGLSPANGVVELGMTQEFCNAPRGYRVILEHSPNLSDAAIISDAERIPLAGSGETILTDSDHPAIEMHRLSLDVGDDAGQLRHLSIRIEANY